MRSLWRDMLTAFFMGLILPGMILNLADYAINSREEAAVRETEPETVPEGAPLSMRLRGPDGTTEELDMDSYLVSVVLAEMSASFEPEALKAQAVAARTYTRKAWLSGGKHGDGSVCTQSQCCQGYITTEDYLTRGGTQEGIEKISAAVAATSGMVLTYEGELIEAVYFSCSGGTTEDAAAVWGSDFPYLQAVSSPGEEAAAHYTDELSFTPQQFRNALGAALPGTPDTWFGAVTYTEGGGVYTMTIGGEVYSGTQLRSLLGLPSTNFTVTAGEERITITTKGYGHRVGMSQYGADAMAVTGSSFEEILTHYYQGAALTRLEG